MKRASIVIAALAAATLAAAAEEGVSSASAPQAAAEGNPLWAIPSDSLSATRDRPLFSRSRRPAAVAVAPVSTPTATVVAKPAAPEPPPFKLLGTIVGLEARVALLKDRSSSSVLRVHEGETQSGWRAVKVAARSIVLARGADTVTLDLPKPDAAADDPSEQSAQADADGAVAATAPVLPPTNGADPDTPRRPDGDAPAGPGVLPRFRH
ncbi:MAG TPA: hypothetical protein VGH40_09560 [Roseiarcus sp.]